MIGGIEEFLTKSLMNFRYIFFLLSVARSLLVS